MADEAGSATLHESRKMVDKREFDSGEEVDVDIRHWNVDRGGGNVHHLLYPVFYEHEV